SALGRPPVEDDYMKEFPTRLRPLLLGGLGLLLCGTGSVRIQAEPVPQQPNPAEVQRQRLTLQQQAALEGLLYRDPDQERGVRLQLEDAPQALRMGRIDQELAALQTLLNEGEDQYLLWEEGSPISLHQHVREL